MKKQNIRITSGKSGIKYLSFLSMLALCFFIKPTSVMGQRSWTFNFSLGDAYCFKMPLTIEQEGNEKVKLTAHYHTESFHMPVYYSWKIGTAKGQRGWELELTHLKIILANRPPEIQEFRVSHGYNYLTVNHIWDLDVLILRFGAGLIVAHPESTVRNLSYDTELGFLKRGYHISGAGLQIAAEKRFYIIKGFFLDLEAKAAAAYARVGVAEGHATVPQAGFHGLFGIGYTFNRNSRK
jgi:hypothetical protein